MQVLRGFVVTAAMAYLMPSVATAGYAQFDQTTDNITVAGHTALGTSATYEAVIRPTTGGHVWQEHQSFAEDKQFGLTSSFGLYGYSHAISGTVIQDGAAAAGAWHHYAYVYDGSEERIYLDGALVTSRARTGDIADGAASNMTIGFAPREGSTFFAGFVGDLDSLRISNVARYAGASFTPTIGDLADDANALVLFNFNEAPGTVLLVDEGSGFVGTMGGQGTMPTLVPEPSAVGVTAAAALLLAACRRRRHR